jgi:hypothetical protein
VAYHSAWQGFFVEHVQSSEGKAMAYSFNGIGTEYHGKREVQPDGSYITTKFFCLIVPLIPIASYRVTEVGGQKFYFGGSKQHYQSTQVPLNWKQVMNVYLVEGLIVGVLIAGAVMAKLRVL